MSTSATLPLPAIAARDPARCTSWQRRDPADQATVVFARKNGYVALAAAVDRDIVAAIGAQVNDWLDAQGMLDAAGQARHGARWRGDGFDDPRWIALQQHVFGAAAAATLIADATLGRFLRALLGDDLVSRRGDICRVAWPAGRHHTTRPHQDGAYMPTAAGPKPWTVWIPLRPCRPDDGGLGLWPDSFGGGLLDHAGAGLLGGCEVPAHAMWLTGELDVGDALVFAPDVVHRAWPNLSADAPRISVDLRYSAG